jgi:ferredoxin
MKRKIIRIDEAKCNGCGQCIPNSPEGAIKVIDGKARLVSDLFCDGLGACLGHCPQGAIETEEREAQPYDERKVIEVIASQGANTIAEHLDHLKSHGQDEFYRQATDYLREKGIPVPRAAQEKRQACGCPGAKVRSMTRERRVDAAFTPPQSELTHWPVQLNLVPPSAPFLRNAELLIAADCVPCAYPGFHSELLRGKVLLVGCPKFDDLEHYREKLTQILRQNDLRSVTYAHMEVPCCLGLLPLIKEAIAASGKKVPFRDVMITVSGEKIEE